MSAFSKNTNIADRRFLLYLVILVIFGLTALMSASSAVGYAKFNDAYFFVKRQVLLGLIPGIILFFICARIKYNWWKRVAWLGYIGTLVVLVLVFVPGIGVTINQSRSWISVGPFSFQPAELAKLAIIILLGSVLADKRRHWNNWQEHLLPILFALSPVFVLILFQPDIGTLSIIAVIVFALLYLGRVPFRHLVILAVLGLVGMAALVMIKPYRLERLTTFLHPELDPQGMGYQTNQAFLAIGSGGIWGLGWGQSRQKFQYLPEVQADSIFAVIAEEVGLIFSVLIVFFILLIGLRGLKIAKGAPDEFGSLLTVGVMVWFLWQSLLNIGAIVGALPLTGVPLPFISHGGSAFMMLLAAMGIVVNVSKYSRIQ